MASEFGDDLDGSDGVQDEEVEEDFVTDEEWSAVREAWAELEAKYRESASLAERKQQMKERKKSKSRAAVKDARAPLKRSSSYRIPRRSLDQVHREVIVAQVLRDAESTKMRSQWNSLTAGKPKAALPGRRVRFRL